VGVGVGVGEHVREEVGGRLLWCPLWCPLWCLQYLRWRPQVSWQWVAVAVPVACPGQQKEEKEAGLWERRRQCEAGGRPRGLFGASPETVVAGRA
jgi:hypothetical protein